MLFIVLNAVDFIVILWFFPETKGILPFLFNENL